MVDRFDFAQGSMRLSALQCSFLRQTRTDASLYSSRVIPLVSISRKYHAVLDEHVDNDIFDVTERRYSSKIFRYR